MRILNKKINILNYHSYSSESSLSMAGIRRKRAKYRKYDTSLLFGVTDLFRLAENPVPESESNKSPMSISFWTPLLSSTKLQNHPSKRSIKNKDQLCKYSMKKDKIKEKEKCISISNIFFGVGGAGMFKVNIK